MSVTDKIMARVVKAGPAECWLWTGPKSEKGQPHGHVNGRTGSIRRALWIAITGETLPKTTWVGVTCGEQLCLNPDHLRLRVTLDDPTRFWSLVKKPDGATACWEWQSATDKRGYPVFMRSHPLRTIRGNRMAWELERGPIPPGLFVCHRCDNPLCVRPSHLFLGTNQENIADMIAKGRNSRGPKHAAAMKAARERKAS